MHVCFPPFAFSFMENLLGFPTQISKLSVIQLHPRASCFQLSPLLKPAAYVTAAKGRVGPLREQPVLFQADLPLWQLFFQNILLTASISRKRPCRISCHGEQQRRLPCCQGRRLFLTTPSGRRSVVFKMELLNFLGIN